MRLLEAYQTVIIQAMKIGLDFDGVISDCLEIKSRFAKKMYGVDIAPHDFKKEIVFERKLLTPEQYRSLQKKIYEDREIGLTINEVPGMIEGIQTLIKNHEVVIITSRGESSVKIAKEWLGRRKIDLPFISVEYGTDKILAKDCDVFIDDDLEKLLPLVGFVPNLYLFSWPYNQNDSNPAVNLVNNWEDFLNKIKKPKPKFRQ